MDCDIYIKYTHLDFNLEIIDNLIESGWRYNDNGKITFLPLGDVDFDWESTSIPNWHFVYSDLKAKIGANETSGLVLTFEDTDIGCNFIFNPKSDSIIISLSINRKVIPNTMITDYSWYLEKVKVLFNQYIEEIECKDIYL